MGYKSNKWIFKSYTYLYSCHKAFKIVWIFQFYSFFKSNSLNGWAVIMFKGFIDIKAFKAIGFIELMDRIICKE